MDGFAFTYLGPEVGHFCQRLILTFSFRKQRGTQNWKRRAMCGHWHRSIFFKFARDERLRDFARPMAGEANSFSEIYMQAHAVLCALLHTERTRCFLTY